VRRFEKSCNRDAIGAANCPVKSGYQAAIRRTARQALFGGDLSRTTRDPFISRTARIGQSRSYATHNLCEPGNVCLSKQLGCIPLMEPTMISPKVLSTVAAIALVLPMAVPTASFAQNPPGGHGPRVVGGGGAAHVSGGGGGAPRMGMGAGGGVHMGGGAPPMAAAPGPRVSGGGGVAMGGGAPGPRYSGGGGGYRGGYDGGRRHDHDGGGGFIPGAVAGALVGGAIASQGYYGGPGYYAPGYDDQYYDEGAVAVAPAPGGDDAVAYCMQTYRSYDPQSGTYLGNDGYRHPCP
jgi:hypothetical protein